MWSTVTPKKEDFIQFINSIILINFQLNKFTLYRSKRLKLFYNQQVSSININVIIKLMCKLICVASFMLDSTAIPKKNIWIGDIITMDITQLCITLQHYPTFLCITQQYTNRKMHTHTHK